MKLSSKKLADFYMSLRECGNEDIQKLVLLISIELKIRNINLAEFEAHMRENIEKARKSPESKEDGFKGANSAPKSDATRDEEERK